MASPIHPAQLRGLPSSWAGQVGDLLEVAYDRGVTPEEAEQVWTDLVSTWAPVYLASGDWAYLALLEDQIRAAASMRRSINRARGRLDRAAELDEGAIDGDGEDDERRREHVRPRSEAREDLIALGAAASGLGKLLSVEASLARAWLDTVDRLRVVMAQRRDPATVKRLIETGALKDRRWREAMAFLEAHDTAQDPMAILEQMDAAIRPLLAGQA